MREAGNSWHAQSAASVIEELGSDVEIGLTDAQATIRLDRDGPNQLTESQRRSSLRLLISQFNNVLVWVLIVAAFISGALLSEWIDTGVILAIVILNAVLGFTQESRAEGALEELALMSAADARVIRGEEKRIDATDVVAGDILLLEAGDRIAADGRLLEAVHLQTDESALTGESLPIQKTDQALAASLGTADRRNMVFAGTNVTAGRGAVVVTDTGPRTAFGQVAELLEVDEPATPLEVELDRVGKVIAVAALIIAVVIFGVGVLREIEPETMFLIAVALAVAAIPEGLTAIVTVTLSRGVSAMARRNAIVRRLPAVEALGAVSVICSDKTGTLTQNEIRVQELEFAGVRITHLDQANDGRLVRYAHIAALCNDARTASDGTATSFDGDPTEVALLRSVDPILVSVPELRAASPRVDELSFDSTRKAMSTLHRADDGAWELLVKGAPERVVVACSHYEEHDGVRELTPERRQAALDSATRMASDGLRTLALAYRRFDEQPDSLEAAEDDLILVAVAGMSDQVRPEAHESVLRAHRAGIDVVMVTGDHEVTATTVGHRLGIVGEGHRTMGGEELRTQTVDELASYIESYRVFARVDPSDKVNIVLAWQEQDAIVAMTGDGVNDAPALRAADVGVAMGSGTAVARESSSIVLADDNFATIVEAVAQGRAIFANLRHVVYFLLASNTAEVLVMLFGFILFGTHGEPLLATQLLWINLVTDGLPALALGVDPPSPGLMDNPPTSDHRFLRRERQRRILEQGSLLALGALAIFVYGYWLRDLPFDEARTLLFTGLVVLQLFHAYNARAEGAPLLRSGDERNVALMWATVTSFGLQVAVVYTAVGQRLFETNPIAAIDWLAIAAMTVVSFVAIRVVTRRPLA